jgi:hypothetical protein
MAARRCSRTCLFCLFRFMTARSICAEGHHASEGKLRCTASHAQILGCSPGVACTHVCSGP